MGNQVCNNKGGKISDYFSFEDIFANFDKRISLQTIVVPLPLNSTRMKKTLLFFVFTCFSACFAQITTPGTGQSFTFGDFVNDPSGAVAAIEPGRFTLTQNLTISSTDTLWLDAATLSVQVADSVTITISGCVLCEDRNNTLEISGMQANSNTRFQWRFEEASSSVLKNLKIEAGESITLIQSSVSIQNCEFSQFNSQVIKYINCNPVILHCDFHDNRQAAISSGANVTGSPIICYNRFYHNVTDNGNQPQINLGPGTSGQDIVIEGNTIEGCSPMSGGIAIANLMNIGYTTAVIRNNTVENNRYGYTQQGSSMYALIEDNTFRNNNLETNPMNGGSGTSIYGNDTTCAAKLRRNVITGKLWGITAIYYHNIDMGTADDYGHNSLYDNGNDGTTYALYNNAVSSMTAVGNYWGGNTEEFAESVIFHRPDLGDNYGRVLYSPILTEEQESVANYEKMTAHLYPNPTCNTLTVETDKPIREITIFDQMGRMVAVETFHKMSLQWNLNIASLHAGIYIIKVVTSNGTETAKFVKN